MKTTEPHLNLTNPITKNSLVLSPKEITLIYDLLLNNSTNHESNISSEATLTLEIKLASFLDDEGFPIA